MSSSSAKGIWGQIFKLILFFLFFLGKYIIVHTWSNTVSDEGEETGVWNLWFSAWIWVGEGEPREGGGGFRRSLAVGASCVGGGGGGGGGGERGEERAPFSLLWLLRRGRVLDLGSLSSSLEREVVVFFRTFKLKF